MLSGCFVYKVDVTQCTNTDNGALDITDFSCDIYNDHPEDCGDYDDDDFKANEMCCACKTSGKHILINYLSLNCY